MSAIEPSEKVPVNRLIGLLYVAGILCFVLALGGTRQKFLRLNTLTFLLGTFYCTVIIDGILDQVLSEAQLKSILYAKTPFHKDVLSLTSICSIFASLVFMAKHRKCECVVCCKAEPLARDPAIHRHARFQAALLVYAGSFLWIFVAMGLRINVRMRFSAIQPVTETLHWNVLKAPSLLAINHYGAVLLVMLFSTIYHCQCGFKSSNISKHRYERTLHGAPKACGSPRKKRSSLKDTDIKGRYRRYRTQCKQERKTTNYASNFTLQYKKLPSEKNVIGNVSELISSDSESEEFHTSGWNKSITSMPLGYDTKNIMNSPVAGGKLKFDIDSTWEECFDEFTQRVYYYCRASGQSRWNNPFDGYDNANHEKRA